MFRLDKINKNKIRVEQVTIFLFFSLGIIIFPYLLIPTSITMLCFRLHKSTQSLILIVLTIVISLGAYQMYSSRADNFRYYEEYLNNNFKYSAAIWYSMQRSIQLLGWPFSSLAFISISIIYGVKFYILNSLKAPREFYLFILICTGFYAMFCSYHYNLAIAIFMLGIYFLFFEESKLINSFGMVFVLSVPFFHRGAFILLFIFILNALLPNLYRYVNRGVLLLTAIVGVAIKTILGPVLAVILTVLAPHYAYHYSIYLDGEWSNYSALWSWGIYIYILYLVVIHTMMLIYLIYYKNTLKKYLPIKYINFTIIYSLIGLLFIGFYTIHTRLIMSGFYIIYLPILITLYKHSSIVIKNKIFLFFLLTINPFTFAFIFYYPYESTHFVGNGYFGWFSSLFDIINNPAYS